MAVAAIDRVPARRVPLQQYSCICTHLQILNVGELNSLVFSASLISATDLPTSRLTSLA